MSLPASRRPLVLVVEDDPIVRMIACEILTDHGMDCAQAQSTGDAIAILDDGHDIALVFTDIDLPGGRSGLDLARHVKARSKPVPVVITSGGTALDRAPGDAPVLQKPYNAGQLVTVVSAALGLHKP